MTPVQHTLGGELTGFVLHSLMAAIVGTIVALLSVGLFGGLGALLGFRSLTSTWPLNPLIWLSAGSLGFVANRSMQHRSACLVGILGVLTLIVAMHWDVSLYERSSYYRNVTGGHPWRYELSQLFSRDERVCAASECLGRVLITLPFLSSLAYSIGAWLWIRSDRKNDRSAFSVS
jgi:hypothetical protein